MRAPVHLMTDHIAQRLTGTSPLTKITTHPSNISKDSLLQVLDGPGASTETEMKQVFARTPLFIAKTRDLWRLTKHPAAPSLLADTLESDYALATEIDGELVYRKKQRAN